MAEPIKHQHDAFGAYGTYDDWGFDESEPAIQIYMNGMNNQGTRTYLTLTLQEAAQAIDIIKDAVKQAKKETKKIEKRKAKRNNNEGRVF